MKPHPNERYLYRVQWSEEDHEFLGLCAEFPSLSWLAESQEKALRGIRKVINDVVKDMKENNEPIPEPLSIKKYSGKFIVRVLPEVHRMLAFSAAEEGVSLNRFISAKLSYEDYVRHNKHDVVAVTSSEYMLDHPLVRRRHPRTRLTPKDVSCTHR